LKTLFRKTEVHSRAELVAVLVRPPSEREREA